MTEEETVEWESGPWTEEYILIDSLGGGGQGNTFLAKTKSDQKDVAVKILRADRDNGKARRRMAREVSALQALAQTDAVIPDYIKSNISEALGNKGIRPFVVMEYISGRTLNTAIESDGPMGLEGAIGFVQTLSETVAIAHSEDTVHRDIKPQNIVLKGEDYLAPYLIDFGLSFNAVTDVKNNLTAIDERIGNRFLTLPESSLRGSDDKQNPASDVTVLAGVLFYVLTGKYPEYLHKNHDKSPHRRERLTLNKIKDEDLQFLNQFFDRAFQYEIEDRFKNTGEFQDRLKNLSDQCAGKIPVVDPRDTAAEIRKDIAKNDRRYQLQLLTARHQGCFNRFKQYLKSRSKDKTLSPTVMRSKNSEVRSNEIEILQTNFSPAGFPQVTVNVPNYKTGFGVCRYFIFVKGGSEVTVGFQSAVSTLGASAPNVQKAINEAPYDEIYKFYDWSKDADDFITTHFNSWFDQTLRQISNAGTAKQ